jgi:hypothetical protein
MIRSGAGGFIDWLDADIAIMRAARFAWHFG